MIHNLIYRLTFVGQVSGFGYISMFSLSFEDFNPDFTDSTTNVMSIASSGSYDIILPNWSFTIKIKNYIVVFLISLKLLIRHSTVTVFKIVLASF